MPPLKRRKTTMLNSETKTDRLVCLLTVISDPGKADAMARFALQNGAGMAYHFYAHGTAPGHLLALLGLSGIRREMISLTVPQDQGDALLDKLCQQFHIGRDMNGIAFLQRLDSDGRESGVEYDYVMIAAVVNEGDGEYVIESARRCHPVGATILRALGTADHSKKTFDFEIVPQKEVVLIIARTCHTDALHQAIYQDMCSEQPGRGILFSLALDRVAGLLDMVPDCRESEETDLPQAAREEDHFALFVVAGRGHTARIMECVEDAGGTGATILHCRLATPESGGWYGSLGDPEKEIVLVIAESEKTRRIREKLEKIPDDLEGQPYPVGQLRLVRFNQLSEVRDAL